MVPRNTTTHENGSGPKHGPDATTHFQRNHATPVCCDLVSRRLEWRRPKNDDAAITLRRGCYSRKINRTGSDEVFSCWLARTTIEGLTEARRLKAEHARRL